MHVDLRRAQPRSPEAQGSWIGVPLLVVALTTFLVALEWSPLMDFDSAVSDAAYDITYGREHWTNVLTWVADWIGPMTLRILVLAAAVAMMWRRHLRVALWMILVTVAEWLIAPASKEILDRPRPSHDPLIVDEPGWSYPSGHAAAGGYFAAVAVLTTMALLPRGWLRRSLCALWIVIGAGVGLDRIFLDVHFATDVVGGWALGVLLVMIGWALLLRLAPEPPGPVPSSAGPRPSRLAVVLNPTKVADPLGFRTQVAAAAVAHGWDEPMWFETTPDDPGTSMAEDALAAGAEMVIAAGGDGTVRVVCTELARTGVPVGIVPLGTGNLLTRNLGLPLHIGDAIQVAMSGQDRAVDIVTLAGDGIEDTSFTVMAGLGLDAAIMHGAADEMKARMGSSAYVVSALRQIRYPAVRVEISVDDAEPVRRRARTVVIGNVGAITGGIPLIPDARIDDGLLDVVVVAPVRTWGWLALLWRVLTRRRRTDHRLDRMRGRSVVIRAEKPTPRQLDGDTIPDGQEIRAEVLAGTLLVRVPRSSAARP
ncbi:MAG TPA: diacylglycerol kinase family protein [Nocardioidaceae bacterium]|nr:diacylglycerol kinase family protein [Nocardioidaceae bacterium]